MAQNPPPKIICQMQGVSKSYPNKAILKNIYLSYYYGAKIGVLGLNGSGKSSLLKILAGVDKEYDGEIIVTPGYSLGFLPQEPLLNSEKTVLEEIEQAVLPIKKLLDDFNQISESFGGDVSAEEMEKLIEKQANLQEKIDHLNAWDLDNQLEMAMDALRCPKGDQKVKTLSGGERRRVALCRLLLEKPDILLLDEPTNHLDAETIAWLEHHLQSFPGTVIAVTHDRYFLDNVAGWILEIDRGEGIPWKGNYSSWLEQKEKRLKLEEKEASARQKTLEHEMEWIRMAPKARQTKSKSRIQAYESMLNNPNKVQERDLEIYIPAGPRLGKTVLEVEQLAKGYQQGLLFENLNFVVPAGAIVGVIGPNGAGKTTLFRMIVGEEKPDKGSLKLGETVKMAYVDQSKDALNPNDTVWQAISDRQEIILLGGKEYNSRALVAKFNFLGSDQQKLVKDLSGGERNRVHLARILKSGGNLLLLDEPTNDLDVNTLRALEEALDNFVGSAIVISHDRWFLNRIVSHILAFEGDSEVVFFHGNYSEYEEDYLKRKGLSQIVPSRIKYRSLARAQ